MKLYHFTSANHVPSILDSGLEPLFRSFMSLDQSVVWLTTAEDMRLSAAADMEWIKKRADQGTFTAEEAEQYMTSGFLPGSDVRISVRLEKSKRLFHYATWLGWQTCPVGGPLAKAIRDELSPNAIANWYVYTGTIPPRRFGDFKVYSKTALELIKAQMEVVAA